MIGMEEHTIRKEKKSVGVGINQNTRSVWMLYKNKKELALSCYSARIAGYDIHVVTSTTCSYSDCWV